MQHFGTTEVSRLTGIPLNALRSMVRAGYVAPATGSRGSLRFSFHDLVLLRTARSLLRAGLSSRKVGEALRTVRAQLPATLPARGLSVTAAGGRVVVHEAGEKRDALTGQLLLAFEVRMDGDRVQLIDIPPPRAQPQSAESAESASGDCERDFAAALALESSDLDAAMDAYRACVARHSDNGARVNLGRLLHLQGRISDALALYEAAQAQDADVDLLYNKAVALEDLGRTEEAIAHYLRVIDLDDEHAEAHHNLARLWQQAGDHHRAVRHWNAWRKLSRE